MKEINFNNKTFALIENSKSGSVDSDTIFKYQQTNKLVTADYSGGTIVYGKIIANLIDDKLHMLYQCFTTDNQLKAGKAIAKISFTQNDKIKLTLNWEWLDDNNEKGTSEYIEM